jgi:hypothetical protein
MRVCLTLVKALYVRMNSPPSIRVYKRNRSHQKKSVTNCRN